MKESTKNNSKSRETVFKIGNWSAMALSLDHADEIGELFARCGDYFKKSFNIPPPTPENIRNNFSQEETGENEATEQLSLGLFTPSGKIAGLIHALQDYPDKGCWFLGLLLLEPSSRGQGQGEKIYQAFEKWAGESGANRIRLGVLEQNKGAIKFWKRMGFKEIERREPKKFGEKESVVYVMEKRL